MHNECKWRRIEVPRYLQKWIDLKVCLGGGSAAQQQRRELARPQANLPPAFPA